MLYTRPKTCGLCIKSYICFRNLINFDLLQLMLRNVHAASFSDATVRLHVISTNRGGGKIQQERHVHHVTTHQLLILGTLSLSQNTNIRLPTSGLRAEGPGPNRSLCILCIQAMCFKGKRLAFLTHRLNAQKLYVTLSTIIDYACRYHIYRLRAFEIYLHRSAEFTLLT
jgi:hypothetical protein